MVSGAFLVQVAASMHCVSICTLIIWRCRLVWLVRSKQPAAVKSGWLLEITANLRKSKLEDGEGAL